MAPEQYFTRIRKHDWYSRTPTIDCDNIIDIINEIINAMIIINTYYSLSLVSTVGTTSQSNKSNKMMMVFDRRI